MPEHARLPCRLLVTVFSGAFLFLACAGVKRGGATVTHRAGLKTMVWYETRAEAAQRIAQEKGAPDDVELEASLLPAGGLILVQKDDHESGGLFQGAPSGVGSRAPGAPRAVGGAATGTPGSGSFLTLEKPFTTPERIQVLVEGQVVHTCDALEQSDQEGTKDSMGRRKKYEYCGVRAALPREFDIVLLNYKDDPVGKYHVVQK